jgi:hypothetical protein
MTTGTERTQALIYAGNFLEELAASKDGLDFAMLEERARHLLRHYPSNMEIGWIANAAVQSSSAIMGPVLDPFAVPEEIQKGYRRW